MWITLGKWVRIEKKGYTGKNGKALVKWVSLKNIGHI